MQVTALNWLNNKFSIPETFEQSSGRSRQENVYHAAKDASHDTKEKEKEVNTLGRT